MSSQIWKQREEELGGNSGLLFWVKLNNLDFLTGEHRYQYLVPTLKAVRSTEPEKGDGASVQEPGTTEGRGNVVPLPGPSISLCFLELHSADGHMVLMTWLEVGF